MVNAEIARLIEEHTVAAADGAASDAGTAGAVGEAVNLPAQLDAALISIELRAALADFELDDLARLMRMVPFVEDLKHLDNPLLEKDRANKLSELAEFQGSGAWTGSRLPRPS